MRQERVVRTEVLQAVRKQGLSSLEDVGAVILETDDTFSVIKKSTRDNDLALPSIT